jgi:hypothetical protein
MNKKISTLLTAGLLVTSALCGSAWAQTPLTINGIELETVANPAAKATWKSGPYFVIADVDDSGTATASDVLLKVVASQDGKTLTYSGVTLSAGDQSLDLEETAWNFLEYPQKDALGKDDGYLYSLQNIGTAKLLTFDNTNALITEASKSSHDAEKNQFARFAVDASDSYDSQFNQKDNLYLYTSKASGNPLQIGSVVSLNVSGSKIILCKLKTKTLTNDEVAALNDVMGGEGFNLDFKADNKYSWKNDNLSKVNLKAFYVGSEIDLENDMAIPAGVYFATAYPEELNGTEVEITDEMVELFYQCTFLAIDPKGNYDINKADRANGIGYELTTVQGSEMNFFTGARTSDDYSSGEEVYVGNACFSIEVPDPMTAPEAYNIVVSDMHVFVSADKNPIEKHDAKNGYIGVVTDQKENYLVTTTVADALSFTTTNSTLMDGDDLATLLQKEDAPSIYTIQFVSGEKKGNETEYKQYLTIMKSGSAFALASTVEYDEADPMYQFVVTAIDKTDKTITFTNRQTQKSFEVSLYENKEGVYTVYPATQTNVNVEWVDATTTNEEVEFKPVDLANTKIVLTPYTVEDKFATFVNRADGMGLVQFELAKNSDAATAFYVGGTRDDDGTLQKDEILAYVDADNMTQFELIKSEKPVNVLNKYIYLKDTRILTSTARDTVAYYTYAVKAFDDEIDDYYLDVDRSYTLAEKDDDSADKFIIKVNIDGSVSLIEYAANAITGAQVGFAGSGDPKDDEDNAWQGAFNYDLSEKISTGLKTFMVEETPAVSLEAIPQHISIEVARGGFMTMDENKDARLAIASEAGEDLTFWVDTVHSDRNIPSFYIAKGGNFLYNAVDSAEYYAARKNYRFNMENQASGEAKLIFKAGELVSSDTLRTTVDGKSVLVAEKDNAPKKIKGNLAKFQYQIILDENGSDEYVIRQGKKYVSQYNNYFYMDADKKNAVRFFIESQSAPTANEGVEVAAIKVIAGEGNVTIAGAAGKKVVISNILGQVVANTVVSSDNATIAAPQGIVVVAVEGEEAVKAIVK